MRKIRKRLTKCIIQNAQFIIGFATKKHELSVVIRAIDLAPIENEDARQLAAEHLKLCICIEYYLATSFSVRRVPSLSSDTLI